MTGFWDKKPSETVWVDVEGPLRETDAAYLFDIDGEEVWLPKSQVKARKRNLDLTGFVRIEVPRWLAAKNGLVDDKDSE